MASNRLNAPNLPPDTIVLEPVVVTGENPSIPSRPQFPKLTPPPPLPLGLGGSGVTQERSHKNLHTEHAQGEADYTYPFSDNQDIIFYLLRADQDGPTIGGTTNFTRFSDAGPANKEYPLSFLETDDIQTGPYLPSNVQSTPNEAALAATTGISNGTLDFTQGPTTTNLTQAPSLLTAQPFIATAAATTTPLADGTFDLTDLELSNRIPLPIDSLDLNLPGGLSQIYLPVGPVSPPEALNNTNRLIDALASMDPSQGLRGAAQTILSATHGDNPLIPTLIDKALSFDSQAQFDPLDPIQVITSLTEVLLETDAESNSINLLIESLTNSNPSQPITMSLNIVKALSSVIQFYHNRDQVNPQQGAKTLVQSTTGYDLSNPDHINHAIANDQTAEIDPQTLYWTNLLNDLNVKNPASTVKTLVGLTQKYEVPQP